MYTMVLMMAMSGSGDDMSWGHRGGCHGGSSCHGYVAASSCCGSYAPVSTGCYGSGYGSGYGCNGGYSCHGGGRGGFLGLCNRGNSCHGGGGLFHRGGHSCHGYVNTCNTCNTCAAPMNNCCGQVQSYGCTGGMMYAPGYAPGTMYAPGMAAPAPGTAPLTMPPATGATPATPAKDTKKPE